MQQEPIDVFVASMDLAGPNSNMVDFRPTPLPASAPEEVDEEVDEEVADPKGESVTEDASSPELKHPSAPTPATPALPAVPVVVGSPSPSETGSQTS